VAPSTKLPSGRLEDVVVDGSTITVSGSATDPDGVPRARVTDVLNGRSTVIERVTSNGRFSISYTGAAGTHRVCVSLIDNAPAGQAVPIGCDDAVVK
jgi:hypothetical protein